MTNHYDRIVIGAGHNGLVAAAYLARQGKKVLVLERRGLVGGSLVTESFGNGFTVDSVQTGGRLRPDILRNLKLPVFSAGEQPSFISLQTDTDPLTLDPNPLTASESIKRFSEKDARRWGEFVRFMRVSAKILAKAYSKIMPRLPLNFDAREGFGLMDLGITLRLAGRRDMLNFIRALPMTAQELVEEYFESEAVKAAVAAVAIHGNTLGPMSAGTGYTLIHNWLNRGGLAHINAGKAGEITQALANAVKSFGGEIRCDAEVECIQIENQVAKGVLLRNGEQISGDVILSSADPKHTLLKLVGPQDLPPEFVWHTQSIKMRGSLAKVHLLTDGRHGIPSGTAVLAPSIKYLEQAYDAAKYGEISENPYLEVTTNGNTVSIHFQFAPYFLKTGAWNGLRADLENRAINTLAEHFPNLKSSIQNQKSLTPLDLEQTYGLTEGDINHGQLMLDQFLFMRPMPGWSNHKTPIDNLYLCGSGVHGGGGVSGAAGRNVVKVLS
jgi:phytoene dehydrogenase-like protein